MNFKMAVNTIDTNASQGCHRCIEKFLRLAFWHWIFLIPKSRIFSSLARWQMTEMSKIMRSVQIMHVEKGGK